MKKIELNFRMKNEYRVKLIDRHSGSIKSDILFHNTVTDYWKNNIANSFYMSEQETSFYFGLGTGEGTHQASDTQLFNAIWNRSISWSAGTQKHLAGDSFFTYELSISLTENEGNGNLTELSISRGWSGNPGNCVNPICLANFQDAEGHPIIIDKTDSDILTIDVKLKLELDTSSLPTNVHINQKNALTMGSDGSSGPSGKYYTDPTLMGDFNTLLCQGSYPFINFFGAMGSYLLPCSSYYAYLSLNPNKGFGYTNVNYYKTNGSWTRQDIGNQRVYRATFSDVALSNQGNLNVSTIPYQIMSLGFNVAGANNIGIDLPDHDIFPPTELEFQLTGDGSTTDFNLAIPVLMASRAPEVTIDNQSVAATDYDWYGVNWQTIQPWIVSDWNYVTDCSIYFTSSRGQYYNIPTSPYQINSKFCGFGNTEIIYDFQEPITVDCVGRLSTEGVYGAASIEYSLTDPYSWVLVKSWANAAAGSGLEQISPITARYWRIVPNVWGHGVTFTNPQKIGMPVIGDYATVTKPTIRFHTAPGVDSVIKIKAWTEYPVKSEDWIYRTISLDISKGVVE